MPGDSFITEGYHYDENGNQVAYVKNGRIYENYGQYGVLYKNSNINVNYENITKLNSEFTDEYGEQIKELEMLFGDTEIGRNTELDKIRINLKHDFTSGDSVVLNNIESVRELQMVN